MTADVVSIDVARRRRGLRPVMGRGTTRRPTVLEAEKAYPGQFITSAWVVRGGKVAHRVDYVSRHPAGLAGMSRCGQVGALTTPGPDVLVCLRCWPWWKA